MIAVLAAKSNDHLAMVPVLEVWDPMFCTFWLAIIAGKLITGLRLGIAYSLAACRLAIPLAALRPKDAPKISPKV